MIVLLFAVWHYRGRHSAPPEVDPNAPSGESALSTPSDAAGPPAAAELLQGRWVRPDGGYIIEISGIASDGRLDARYYNPRPIHVAKATVSNESGLAKVYLELRDTGYPGATYTLLYKSADDLLIGSYHQPAVGQTFDVVFMRYKPAQ